MSKDKVLTEKQLWAIQLLAEKEVKKRSGSKDRLTNEEIAKIVGVNPSTIYDWHKDRQFKRALTVEAKEQLTDNMFFVYSQMSSVLFDKKISEKNKIAWMQMILRNQGEEKPSNTESITVEIPSLDELNKQNAAVLERARKRRENKGE